MQIKLESGDLYRYRLGEDGRAIIEKCESSANEIRVPEKLEGHAVVAVGESAFAHLFTARRIVLPHGLEAVGPRAFKTCSSLKEVVLPDTLRSVGSEAFRATALERLEIPASCVDAQDDSFCLYGSWESPPSTIRPSMLAAISVDFGNDEMCMRGGVLCKRQAGGLKALLCVAECESVSLAGDVVAVLPAAFTGVKRIAKLRVSERLRSLKRGVVFPRTACDELVVEMASGQDLVLPMPAEEIARQTLAKLFRGQRVDVERAVEAFDDAVLAWPDELATSRAMLQRLSDGRYLSERASALLRRRITKTLEGVCLHFGASSYWLGFDQLMDCGFLTQGNITHVIDALARYDDVAAAGYLLQAKRQRFGEAVWDYDL